MTVKEFENKYRYMSERKVLAKSHCRYVLKQGGEDFSKILQSINNPDAEHRGCCSHKVVAVWL